MPYCCLGRWRACMYVRTMYVELLSMSTMNFCARLLEYHSSSWLVEQRSMFVNSVNSLITSRTGTRLNIGGPQVRWSGGTLIAIGTSATRTDALVGKNAITVSARIREAVAFIRTVAAPSQSES